MPERKGLLKRWLVLLIAGAALWHHWHGEYAHAAADVSVAILLWLVDDA